MSNTVSTITSKWQVTIPEEVRKEFPLKVGQRIVWRVEDDQLVGQRVRSINELAGCFKSKSPPDAEREAAAPARAAIARHERLRKS